MKNFKKTSILICIFTVMIFAMMGCNSSTESYETAEQEEVTEEISEEAAEESSEEASEETAEESETETKKPARKKREKIDIKDYNFNTFELTSEDLHDGVWDTIITNTENGSNVSPQLSWEEVPEAAGYVVYMIDTMAGDWLHWKSNGVTETELPQGFAPEGEYVGPYPPGGTHTYEIYVVALRQPLETIGGTLDRSDNDFMKNIVELDVSADGTSGNIISYGHLAGTYTYGD
ncbi:MAG: hypothetical protein IJ429_02705 [Lachnospiraceae bacterium]|nr:hypothetical protein [Lachnospiraceae bacterium]